MKNVIRTLQDGTFYQSQGTWVAAVGEATPVAGKAEALSLMRGQDLSSLELLNVSDEGVPVAGHLLASLARDRWD